MPIPCRPGFLDLWHHWHFGPDNSQSWGVDLCILGHLAASLVIKYQSHSLNHNNYQCLQPLTNVPGGTKSASPASVVRVGETLVITWRGQLSRFRNRFLKFPRRTCVLAWMEWRGGFGMKRNPASARRTGQLHRINWVTQVIPSA